MANVRIGSARQDEHGKLSGGKAGDQTGREVSEQAFYVHRKGWYVIRPKSATHAEKIAERMRAACNNSNLGYDQGNRLGVIRNGIDTKVKTECDCSALVRACVKEATGKDPGNFTTANERSALGATKLFEPTKSYKSGMELCTGDILVTKTKGHTVVVTEGAKRTSTTTATQTYYPKYAGSSTSLVDALKAVGEKDTTLAHRDKIAKANGMLIYNGSATQNLKLLSMLKKGTLIKA